jgi:hypothetical protein
VKTERAELGFDTLRFLRDLAQVGKGGLPPPVSSSYDSKRAGQAALPYL